ncbi:MAG: tRNA uridine-5-carboxymethylaminomethyl(34) synthesis GTPase MnmE [Candidatus Zixiibacteriota bacterium]
MLHPESKQSAESPSAEDTIAAIITPPGEGGVAALRLAGPRSRAICSRHFRSTSKNRSPWRPFVMRYGHFHTAESTVIDEIMVVYMPAGRSYTGLEQVELFCHGGRQVVRLILDELLRSGARAAEPGEFTRLAFENGRIDLARAEAVAELIAANTMSAYQASREHLLGAYSEHISMLRDQLVRIMAEFESMIDFPDEEIPQMEQTQLTTQIDDIAAKIRTLLQSYAGGRIINEGFRIAIAGRPNAGKSSLFNLLLRQERALVNPRPGTTRDYLSEWVELGGVAVNIIDTAGLRQGGGAIERLGQKRTKEIMRECHLVIWMVDISKAGWVKSLDNDVKALPVNNIIIVGNKIDLLGEKQAHNNLSNNEIIFMSCSKKSGFKNLEAALVKRIADQMPDMTAGLVVTSARHKQKLNIALRSLIDVRKKTVAGDSPEIVAFSIRQATNALDEITGRLYTEEVLGHIFGKFCIGK